MKQTKTYQDLIAALENGALESHSQANYLFKILNNGTEEQKEQIKDFFRDENFEGITLSVDNVEQGRAWLMNLWKTPTGAERKNNPFGYREQHALENFDTIQLKGYYDAGNYNFSHYIPLFDVYAKDGYGFEYHVAGGKISITG